MNSMIRSYLPISCALVFIFSSNNGQADDPATQRPSVPATSVRSVVPGNFIFHGIEVQTKRDASRQFYKLKGPRFFDDQNHLNWYEIYKPKPIDNRDINVTVGKSEATLELGLPSFFGTPNQVLRDGPASSIDQQANLYVAYLVKNANTLSHALGVKAGEVPVYLAIPAEEWHHDDYFGIAQPKRGVLLVAQPQPTDTNAEPITLSVLDQFSLNHVQVGRTVLQSFGCRLAE